MRTTMKTFKSMQVALAAALVALVGGCANEDLTTNLPGKNGKLVTISVGMPTDAKTRVAFDDANLLLKWQADDKLAISRNNDSREYTLNEGFEDGTKGKFTGEVVDEEGSGSYTVTYPANFTSMDGQRQTEDNNTDHLKDYIVLGATPDNLTDAFALEMKSSIMKFVLTNLPNDIGMLRRLTWKAEGNTGTTSLTLNLEGCSVTGDALTAYLSFLPENMDIKPDGKFSVIVNGDKTYQADVTIAAGKSYDAGNRYEAAMDRWVIVTDQMQFTVSDVNSNWRFNIPFPNSGTTPAELTVDWGDGSEAVVVPKGTALRDGDQFEHIYSAAGTYTITITSGQGDATQQQMPRLNFGNARNNSYEYAKKLTGITPLLNTKATDFNSCFYRCSALTEIPVGLFDKNTEVTDFQSCFYECSSLTKIPAGFFDKYTEATNFSYCFSNCKSLTKIPAGLFDNNTKVTNFSYCFAVCSSITEIPVGLFDNNTKVTNFSNCFTVCSSITEIPAGLFDKHTVVTNFSYCFFRCSSITEIPVGLFDNNTKVTDFSYCFSGCSSITEIPVGLFDNNTVVTNFSNCFASCSITEIPAGLFDNNTVVTNFQGCFYNCKSITKIPKGLFDNNTKVENFGQTFNACLLITEIPEGLFDKNTAATTFGLCFASCVNLKLNDKIFSLTADKQNRFKDQKMDFGYCFQDVGTSLTPDEVSLSIAPDLWNYAMSSVEKVRCFENCKVSNSGDIPGDWQRFPY